MVFLTVPPFPPCSLSVRGLLLLLGVVGLLCWAGLALPQPPALAHASSSQPASLAQVPVPEQP